MITLDMLVFTSKLCTLGITGHVLLVHMDVNESWILLFGVILESISSDTCTY